jgi:hypothetical protein
LNSGLLIGVKDLGTMGKWVLKSSMRHFSTFGSNHLTIRSKLVVSSLLSKGAEKAKAGLSFLVAQDSSTGDALQTVLLLATTIEVALSSLVGRADVLATFRPF